MYGILRRAMRRSPLAKVAYHALRDAAGGVTLSELGRYRRDFDAFRALAAVARPARFALDAEESQPHLGDRTETTAFEPHYLYHPAWAARVLARTRPARHVDVGSSLRFVAVASAFVPFDFYDYRPAAVALDNLTTGSADLLALPFETGSIPSLSCMHVVEHVGLGRYGDALDYDGDLKAMAELTRVLAPGGDLLFVVPVGRPRICFNAHRIYDYEQVVSAFAGLTLKSFSCVLDDAARGLVEGASPALVRAQEWGCGCFWFSKPAVERR